MFDDMRTEGVYPVVGEGYRSEQQQQEMMQEKIDAYLAEGYSERKARKEAEKWVAKPNYSEHQLGLALDINADKSRCDNDTIYQWLSQNAYRYGFILRYPSDKTETTGTPYAPHHFRYVGKIHAAIMHENNFCLEEYLDYLRNYTMESGGLAYSDGVQSYTIYYVPADASGTTTVSLPENAVYTVSGDNSSGFIITLTNGAVTPDSSSTEPASETGTTTAAY